MKPSQKLTNELVEPYFAKWDAIRERILKSHELRDGSSHASMLEAIQVLRQLLRHCEGLASPLNCTERLSFIEQQPAKFAAFRQLDVLFSETKKAIVSKRIQTKHYLI